MNDDEQALLIRKQTGFEPTKEEHSEYSSTDQEEQIGEGATVIEMEQ